MSSAALSERLAAALVDAGVGLLFGVPGGGPNLELIGAAEAAGIGFVLAHGETAAAIMASTNGLLAGRPSGVVVTRGPGAASLANGLAQATLDRHPLVAMTDTVPTAGRDRVAHQRLDQVALLGPVSKRSVTVGPSAG
ncbi:MAG: thiamine pyrophosphate-binding protein, partial [Actinomycetota bacterium]